MADNDGSLLDGHEEYPGMDTAKAMGLVTVAYGGWADPDYFVLTRKGWEAVGREPSAGWRDERTAVQKAIFFFQVVAFITVLAIIGSLISIYGR